MPPLVEIPVISRSDTSAQRPLMKGKAPIRPQRQPRSYNDGPLPVKPSEHAPKNARIIGRVIEPSGVTYQLKIGEVEINDVGLEEILHYVSALDLEEYENAQFEEEGEVLKALKVEQERLKREKLDQLKERAKRKGVVAYEDESGTDEEIEGGQEVLGKHGRARPTYTHLFKKFPVRGSRKEDPETDQALPTSDEVEDEFSADGAHIQARREHPTAPLAELPKRRRRKRDKVTGDLIPLAPVAQSIALEKKRQRRRRHPLTGQLMPVGWRYNPGNETTYESRRVGQSSPSFRKLSISQGQETKRQKLDTESDFSRSPSPILSKAELAAQMSPQNQRTPKASNLNKTNKDLIVELLTSGDESAGVAEETDIRGNLRSPAKRARTTFDDNRQAKLAMLSSAAQSSPEPEGMKSLMRPAASKHMAQSSQQKEQTISPAKLQPAKTSILHPSAGRASSTEPFPLTSEADSSGDDADNGEWFIEAVLAHQLSDPKTHPPSLGPKAVMLYQVKWEGYDEPTWEPIDSFTDGSVVNEYHHRVGLATKPNDDDAHESDLDITMVPSKPNARLVQPQAPMDPKDQIVTDADDDGDDLEDDEFEVESIIGHQLSDPRTHPPELRGKGPMLLYKVKWKGFVETTWEPASSFEDQNILQQYNKRAGLMQANDDSDDEMFKDD